MLVAQAKNVTIQVIGLLKLKKKYKIKKPPCLEWLFFKLVRDYALLNTPTFQAIATTPKRINVLWTLFPPNQFGLLMSNKPFIIFLFNY